MRVWWTYGSDGDGERVTAEAGLPQGYIAVAWRERASDPWTATACPQGPMGGSRHVGTYPTAAAAQDALEAELGLQPERRPVSAVQG